MAHPHAAQMLTRIRKEYLYPNEDISGTGWVYNTGSSLYECVNEPTTPSDSDYVYTTTFGPKTMVLGFPAPSGTPTGNNIKLRVRSTYIVIDEQEPLTDNATIELLDGTTVVGDAFDWNPTGSYVTDEFTPTATPASYADLRVRVITDEGIVDDQPRVSWIELEIEVT